MNINDVSKILCDTAYVRYGGSDAEKSCALYIKEQCEKLGLTARIESFKIRGFAEEKEGVTLSHNIILDIEGESDETVVVSAHYDSSSLSFGAYDNMSGVIALIYLAERFSKKKLKRNLRLLWCGSEERGLIGSYEYCLSHKKELKSTILNINLDMLGSAYGKFVVFSCTDENTTEYLKEYFKEKSFGATVKYNIRSSDSNSFIIHGVPAVSFARYAKNTSFVHTKDDTMERVSPTRLIKDSRIIATFTEHLLNSPSLPSFDISSEIMEKTEANLSRYNYYKKTKENKNA